MLRERLCWTGWVWVNKRRACAAIQLLKSPAPCVSHKFLKKSSRIVFSCLLHWFEEGLDARHPQHFPLGEGIAAAGASPHPTPPRLWAVRSHHIMPLLSFAAHFLGFPCLCCSSSLLLVPGDGLRQHLSQPDVYMLLPHHLPMVGGGHRNRRVGTSCFLNSLQSHCRKENFSAWPNPRLVPRWDVRVPLHRLFQVLFFQISL